MFSSCKIIAWCHDKSESRLCVFFSAMSSPHQVVWISGLLLGRNMERFDFTFVYLCVIFLRRYAQQLASKFWLSSYNKCETHFELRKKSARFQALQLPYFRNTTFISTSSSPWETAFLLIIHSISLLVNLFLFSALAMQKTKRNVMKYVICWANHRQKIIDVAHQSRRKG